MNHLLGPNQEGFLTAQLKLENAYKLVKHLKDVIPVANEVVLYDILSVQVRKYIQSTTLGTKRKDIEKSVSKLVDESIEAREVIDIFAVAGIEKPDISILDEKFMADLTQKKRIRRKEERKHPRLCSWLLLVVLLAAVAYVLSTGVRLSSS